MTRRTIFVILGSALGCLMCAGAISLLIAFLIHRPSARSIDPRQQSAADCACSDPEAISLDYLIAQADNEAFAAKYDNKRVKLFGILNERQRIRFTHSSSPVFAFGPKDRGLVFFGSDYDSNHAPVGRCVTFTGIIHTRNIGIPYCTVMVLGADLLSSD